MSTEDLKKVSDKLLAEIKNAGDLETLEKIRIATIGKQGSITELFKTISKASPEERKGLGKRLNQVKEFCENAILTRKQCLELDELQKKIAAEKIDITLPVRPELSGTIHPISQAIDEMLAIFCEMGFEVAEGPDIETDFNKFTEAK